MQMQQQTKKEEKSILKISTINMDVKEENK